MSGFVNSAVCGAMSDPLGDSVSGTADRKALSGPDVGSADGVGTPRAPWRWDDALASAALVLMVLIPLVEMAVRPLAGQGVDNAPVLVQHLGLVLAMVGALAAQRSGHLTTLGLAADLPWSPRWQRRIQRLVLGGSAVLCGVLAWAGWQFVSSELEFPRSLAYGVPTAWVQAFLPLGFAAMGWRLGRHCTSGPWLRGVCGLVLPLAGAVLAWRLEGWAPPMAPVAVLLALALIAGAPIFVGLGGLALLLFASDGLPLASVALSHYQITVNPSLPALPLFTLAGLVFARTGAAARLGALFLALFGQGVRGTVLATAVLCSAFTATTGGSGVTILALGGLLLPMLRRTGYPEQRSVGLITSASALGVLLAPSVPLIMFAVLARVPITDMFLAGVLPAVLMVLSLLVVGGFLRAQASEPTDRVTGAMPQLGVEGDASSAGRAAASVEGHHCLWPAVWAARWELLAPVVAIGSLAGGLATPTEGAALTAAYAVCSQAWAHRELDRVRLLECLSECVRLIGGVMLILGMALALTNFLIDAGVPDRAIDTVQALLPDRHAFLLALCMFLFIAAALMEIFAALVVLVPLLLPLTQSYGIDPLHFGVIFLAAMEVGFLCPPAGLNLYFASAMFGKPVRWVGVAVLPAMLAIFVGTVVIALVPGVATWVPHWGK